MGLFDFVKDAGEKLQGLAGGLVGGDAKAAEAASGKIAEAITANGIAVEGLKIEVDGDTAVLRGSVATQADREKAILVAGNIQGIARVDDQISVETPEPEATFYTVKRGDSLSKIAKAHYGDAMKYPVLFEANRPMLSDPDKIYPGQVLRIPAE